MTSDIHGTSDVHRDDEGRPPSVYYGTIPPGRTRANPAGVVRRSVVDGRPLDEAFTRNLTWERTTALLEHEFGHNDLDYVEISPAEAETFVQRITATSR